MFSTSRGSGRYVQTPSSSSWTALLPSAEPHMTGVHLSAMVESRRHLRISSGVTLSSSIASASSSLTSERPSSISSRILSHSSLSVPPWPCDASGCSASVGIGPRSICSPFSPWNVYATISIRSTTPSSLSSRPIGHWIMTGLQLELLAELVADAERVRAGAVELVDERDARNLVAAHLAVDRVRLRLHAGDAAQHHDRAVEDAQRALDLDREVDVARGVDDVDVVLRLDRRARDGHDRLCALASGGHWQNVAADWIVMPRSRSSSIESIFAPTPSLPFTS